MQRAPHSRVVAQGANEWPGNLSRKLMPFSNARYVNIYGRDLDSMNREPSHHNPPHNYFEKFQISVSPKRPRFGKPNSRGTRFRPPQQPRRLASHRSIMWASPCRGWSLQHSSLRRNCILVASPSTTEPAEPPADVTSDDAAARVGKFLFTMSQSDKPRDDDARVRALTNWLLHSWESDQREEVRHVQTAC